MVCSMGRARVTTAVEVFAVKAAGPLVSRDAVKVEVISGEVQGETAIFISRAAAARRIAEEIFFADLNLALARR